ncbi:MAG: VWA domain-containing protein [Myxococcales bacterium]|nr:VWA domain-containing protein [Myxococcales bacterium]MCB9642681.1 VWA domain-containing protein [Myxococcales bacterium]
MVWRVLLKRYLVWGSLLLLWAFPRLAFAQQGSNCQPPNLMVIIDASNSMGNNNKIASQACTTKASCNPIPFTFQPAPGTTPRYDYSCNANKKCLYTRWDIARNALKEVAYQYGGTAANNYSDRKARFGLVAFNDLATLEATITANPPKMANRLDAKTLAYGTRFTRAFTEARNHLQSVINSDSVAKRPTHILFMTDGAPTDGCVDAPNMVRDMYQGTGTFALKDTKGNIYPVKTYVIGFGSGINASANNCLTKMADLGGTKRCDPSIAGCVAYFFADNAVQLKGAMDAIVDNATQEACDGIDNDCDGKTDEDYKDLGQSCDVGVGECKRTGTKACRPNGSGTRCDIAAGTPAAEICDGKDNDCDGKTDEDFPTLGSPCQAGVGSCRNSGVLACRPDGLSTICNAVPLQPQPEVCDGKDNDCNGQIDDNLTQGCSTACGTGVEFCQGGKWVGCTAPKTEAEVCDGRDNDCNGTVDDGLKRPCTTSCGSGEETCVNGNWVFCDAPKAEPEICDGKDNDCDGKTDEGIVPRACQGDCGTGTAQCVNGAYTGCDGPKPETEVCDGKDNDCNGQIDDGLERDCKSLCGDGKELCKNGSWETCNAPQPKTEICDGQDNDCNGKIDDNATCPTGESCVEGLCRRPCRNGECPTAFQCREGFCFSTTCDNITCPGDLVCKSGQCIDACIGVTCPDQEVCKAGKCVENNCFGLGCPTGEVCKAGQCGVDPCATVTCSSDQYCREGSCVAVCKTDSCAPGEGCSEGKCVPDPCAGVSCANFQRCVNGACQADPCFEVTCPNGRVCADGKCQEDPCLGIQCPAGSSCVEGVCKQPSRPPLPEPVVEGVTEPGDEIASDAEGTISNDASQLDDPTGEKVFGESNSPSERYGSGQAPGCSCQTGNTPLSGGILLFLLVFLRVRRRQPQRAE